MSTLLAGVLSSRTPSSTQKNPYVNHKSRNLRSTAYAYCSQDTREKPFNCKLCDQKFSRRDLLRRHETKTHKIQTSSSNNPESNAQAVVENQALHEVCWDMNQPNSGVFSIVSRRLLKSPKLLLMMLMTSWYC